MSFCSRRTLLTGSLTWAAGRAWAFGDASKFVPALVQYPGRWDARVSGVRRLAWELQRRTSVEVALEVRPIPLASPRLFEHPFLCWSGDSGVAPLSNAEVENLRRYLTYGGFLFIDNAGGAAPEAFESSVRREMVRVLPLNPLLTVPTSHVLFKAFYLLDSVPGRVLNKSFIEGATLGRRIAVMYSGNDVLGALSRDESGAAEFEVTPGGERQRELATRTALNVALYALCLDYKDDAVHLPLILKRRR